MLASHKNDNIGRVLCWVLCVLGLCGALFVVVTGFQNGKIWEGLLLGLLIAFVINASSVMMLVSIPKVILTDEGVITKAVFKTRFYSWEVIKQAGIIYRTGKAICNIMVLVPPKGSRRHYKDKTFFIRNIGKAVCFQVTDENREYVIQHYGPLDFNLSDGREEGSIIAD